MLLAQHQNRSMLSAASRAPRIAACPALAPTTRGRALRTVVASVKAPTNTVKITIQGRRLPVRCCCCAVRCVLRYRAPPLRRRQNTSPPKKQKNNNTNQR